MPETAGGETVKNSNFFAAWYVTPRQERWYQIKGEGGGFVFPDKEVSGSLFDILALFTELEAVVLVVVAEYSLMIVPDLIALHSNRNPRAFGSRVF